MLKLQLGILSLVICLFLVILPAASGSPSAPVVYVAGDGSGDFNCDGKDDHIQINQALKFVANNSTYTTVHLKGPFTYFINDTLLIGSSTILEGDVNAVIKLIDHAGWPSEKPLIKQINPSLSRKGTIIIRGFEINGNYNNNTEYKRGDGYYNFMNLYYDDVEVYDMYMHDSHGDGLRIKYSENVSFHNNKIYKLGHEGLFAIKCQNVEAYDNVITCKTNSALRAWNTNHIKFHDNIIDANFEPDGGGPGIEIQKTEEGASYAMNDIEIYDNIIHDTYGPGIWLFGRGTSYPKEDAQNVHIYHNIFYNCGTNPNYSWVGGIITSGFYDTLIENNVFDGVYHAAVSLQAPFTLPPDTGYTTIVRNNIISNTKQRTSQPNGTGYGVVNYLPETHSFILENNCFYNNSGGDYKNVEPSSSDIQVDPLFADRNKHDYHLKSIVGRWNGETWVKDSVSSPCIDAGLPSSDYSNEPEDNGDRINIGRYGNTIYASLSGTGSATNPDPVVPEDPTVSEILDNRLREASPDMVYQDTSFIDVGGMSTGRYRDVMWFDLSEYTNSTEIDNATLSLYWYYPAGKTRPNDTVIEVYRPASSWNSSYVSWNKKDNGISWTNAGGDWYDKNGVAQGSTPYATITIKGSTLPDNRYYELNVTELVKEYISGKYPNTGLMIRAHTENNNYIAFYSNDCRNETQVPKFNLTKKASPVTPEIIENATTNVTLTGAKDNRLRQASPSTVYQNSTFIDVGGMSNGIYRDVMWFDLSEYTNSTEIGNATLSLYWYYPAGKTRPNDTVIEVYRPASSWNSSYVSWNKKNNGVSWINAGGDWYDKNEVAQGSTPYATITIKGSTIPDNKYYQLNVTDLVKEYINGKYANTGLMIKARTESNNYIAFYSSEGMNENQNPKLEIVYSKT